jgi:hypothetical protein
VKVDSELFDIVVSLLATKHLPFGIDSKINFFANQNNVLLIIRFKRTSFTFASSNITQRFMECL